MVKLTPSYFLIFFYSDRGIGKSSRGDMLEKQLLQKCYTKVITKNHIHGIFPALSLEIRFQSKSNPQIQSIENGTHNFLKKCNV